MNFISTARKKIKSIKHCVLYDPGSGDILLAHTVVTIEGGEETPIKQIEENALRSARDLKVPVSKPGILHVGDRDIEPSKRYKVDVNKRSLEVIK